MKRAVHFCDKCGVQIPEEEKFVFHLFNERRSDPAGSREDWWWEADLCRSCQFKLLIHCLRLLEKLLSHDDRKKLAAEWAKAREV